MGNALSGRRPISVVVATIVLITGLGMTGAQPAGAVAPPIVNSPSTISRLIPMYALRKAVPPPMAGGATVSHIVVTDPDEWRSLRANGWQMDSTGTTNCDGIIGYLFDRPTTWGAGSGQTKPVHRFYNPAFNGYFLNTTDDQAFIDALRIHYGFEDQGIIGHGFTTGTPGGTHPAAPLREFLNGATKELYYSTNVAPPGPGYTDRGAMGYVRPAGPASTDQAVPDTQPAAAQLCPVSMLTRTIDGMAWHLATSSMTERAAKLAAGWTVASTDVPASADGAVGYLWDRPIPGSDPVYRFRHDTLRSYYYLTIHGDPTSVISTRAGLGFISEGIIGYGFSTPQPGTVAWTPALNATGAAYYSTTPAGASYAASHGYTSPAAPIANLLTSADLPTPYYDIHRPAGTPKGIVVYIHGGGWKADLPYLLEGYVLPIFLGDWQAAGEAAPHATPNETGIPERLVADGWTIYSIDYHSGGALAAANIQWFLTQLRQLEPNAKVCTAGASAGGHLALLSAVRRPDIACVISQAGPTNLAANAAVPNPGAGTLITAGFGPNLGPVWTANSPALADLSGRTTRVFMATAAEDTLVPPGQMTLMANALVAAGAPPAVQLTLAARQPGQPCVGFIHGCTSQAQLDYYKAQELAFMNSI